MSEKRKRGKKREMANTKTATFPPQVIYIRRGSTQWVQESGTEERRGEGEKRGEEGRTEEERSGGEG